MLIYSSVRPVFSKDIRVHIFENHCSTESGIGAGNATSWKSNYYSTNMFVVLLYWNLFENNGRIIATKSWHHHTILLEWSLFLEPWWPVHTEYHGSYWEPVGTLCFNEYRAILIIIILAVNSHSMPSHTPLHQYESLLIVWTTRTRRLRPYTQRTRVIGRWRSQRSFQRRPDGILHHVSNSILNISCQPIIQYRFMMVIPHLLPTAL